MIEHIISKMVLDRTCPVCGGVKQYRVTASANTQSVECPNCSGRGYMSNSDNMSVLITPHVDNIPMGVKASMKQQRMLVIDSRKTRYQIFNELRGYYLKRIYTYNVDTDDIALYEAKLKLLDKPGEIHMYFD